MKKEEIKTDLDGDAASGLEKRIGGQIRKNCGLRLRTFECMMDLENISELRFDNPVQKGSGFIRADVLETFYLSMQELIGKSNIYFALHDTVDMEFLVYASPAEDRFLNLLNKKQFDGIHEYAEDPVRLKQYKQIVSSYQDDREIFVNNLHRKYLKKQKSEKRRRWPWYIIGGLFSAVISIGAIAQIATYFTAIELKNETKKEITSTKKEFRGTVSRLEENLQPKKMVETFEAWAATEEGQEYIKSKYSQVKELWIREGLVRKEFDLYWRNEAMPLLEQEYDLNRLKRVAKNLEHLTSMFPEKK